MAVVKSALTTLKVSQLRFDSVQSSQKHPFHFSVLCSRDFLGFGGLLCLLSLLCEGSLVLSVFFVVGVFVTLFLCFVLV